MPFVVFNRQDSRTRTFQTGLPAGTYCDVMSSDFSGGSCSGTTYTVDSSGQFTATVAPTTALALYAGAKVSASAARPRQGRAAT